MRQSASQSSEVRSLVVTDLTVDGYESVVEVTDSSSGLHAIIAIHDTTLGPTLGGTRMMPYQSREEALRDVLRLAEGMTYKSAIAGVGFGGGKSVIIGHPKTQKTSALLHSFAEAVNHLQGSYICAEDMGTTTSDMATIAEKTPFVVGMPSKQSSGDPSPFTAYGVFRGIQAVADKLWATTSLSGKTIAIQGVGHVGARLADLLFWSGARLILADADEQRAHELAWRYRARVVSPGDIHAEQCDIFAPCAIGGILNPHTIPELKCHAVAGAANNQLLSGIDAEELHKRGILYAPDYVINAGGLINVACELQENGYDPAASRMNTDSIFDSLKEIFNESEERGRSTETTAQELARHKIQSKIGKRVESVYFRRA